MIKRLTIWLLLVIGIPTYMYFSAQLTGVVFGPKKIELIDYALGWCPVSASLFFIYLLFLVIRYTLIWTKTDKWKHNFWL